MIPSCSQMLTKNRGQPFWHNRRAASGAATGAAMAPDAPHVVLIPEQRMLLKDGLVLVRVAIALGALGRDGLVRAGDACGRR